MYVELSRVESSGLWTSRMVRVLGAAPRQWNLSLSLLAPSFLFFFFCRQYESYYDHTYYPDKDSLTWKLDVDKTSDFEDVSGHWHVEPHPTLGGDRASRVFYACDIKLAGSVPGPILNYISKAALKQATGWVKKESEQAAKAQGLGLDQPQPQQPNNTDDPPPPSSSSDESVPEPALKKRRFAFGLGNP